MNEGVTGRVTFEFKTIVDFELAVPRLTFEFVTDVDFELE